VLSHSPYPFPPTPSAFLGTSSSIACSQEHLKPSQAETDCAVQSSSPTLPCTLSVSLTFDGLAALCEQSHIVCARVWFFSHSTLCTWELSVLMYIAIFIPSHCCIVVSRVKYPFPCVPVFGYCEECSCGHSCKCLLVTLYIFMWDVHPGVEMLGHEEWPL
jgi:hypothetical protein